MQVFKCENLSLLCLCAFVFWQDLLNSSFYYFKQICYFKQYVLNNRMNCCALTGFIVILVNASLSGFQSSAAEIFALLGYCTLPLCVCFPLFWNHIVAWSSRVRFLIYWMSDIHSVVEYSIQEDLRSQVYHIRMWRQEREHVKK